MTDPLSALPLFATDKELAVAIVGKERAQMWIKAVIPQLERKGFPRIDPLHDGRPVPLVKRFYDGYFGITAGFNVAAPDGKENLGVWKRRREQRQENKPRLDLRGKQEDVLRFMVDRPDCNTADVIPNAGERTMQELARQGALRETGVDAHGDRRWEVTDEGRDEIKRIDTYRNWK